MKPDEIRQLLGGYASGTLSEAEKKLLFEAALEDQALFDAMADEQALKDLLDDPESRGYLQAVLDEPAADAPLHVPAAPQSMAAPAPAPAQSERRREVVVMPVVEPKRRRGPSLWWGALAAAALATVSVIGILRMNTKPAPIEMAKVTTPPVAAPAPVESPVAGKPAVPSTPPAQPAATKTPAPEVGIPEPLPKKKAAEPERKADSKPRDEVAATEGPTSKIQNQAPPASPVALPAPPAQAAGTPQPQKEVALASPQVSQDQLGQFKSALPESARQLYFSGEQDKGTSVDSADKRARASESAAKDEKSKKAEPAPGAVGAGAVGAGVASGRAAPKPLATARAVARAGFALRYKILRKTGQDFVPVPPGTRFRIGDEIVLVIEKNSGGVAVIERLELGSTSPVPLAIQTNELARSVPLTVSGPMELALTLARTGAVQGIPSQSSAQRTEVADGMVYVGEPATASGQALVARVSIRVE